MPLVAYSINFLTNLPESEKRIVILDITDHLFHAVRLIPLESFPTVFELSEIMFNHFFGLPENVVSYWGPQFTSQVWHNLLEKLGTTVSYHSYHPQANGQVERLNQEIGKFLRAFCSDNQRDWAQFLLWAEYVL